jgi:hypothetical protein
MRVVGQGPPCSLLEDPDWGADHFDMGLVCRGDLIPCHQVQGDSYSVETSRNVTFYIESTEPSPYSYLPKQVMVVTSNEIATMTRLDLDGHGGCHTLGGPLSWRSSVLIYILAIYAPMSYKAPCIMFWIRAYPLRGQVGWGWALEMESFFGSFGCLVFWHLVSIVRKGCRLGASCSQDLMLLVVADHASFSQALM